MPKNSSKWIYLGMAKDHDELRLNSITLLIGKMYSLQEKLLGYGYVFSFFSSVQLFSHVWFFATHEQQHARPPCSSPTPGVYPNSCHWVGDAIKPSHPLSSLSPPALNLSSIKVFSNEYALHIRWPKYWSFSFSISPSNEHPGLVSFRMDWLELLAVQGTLKSLLQHHSSKASILQCSAFFTVQGWLRNSKKGSFKIQVFWHNIVKSLKDRGKEGWLKQQERSDLSCTVDLQ